MSLIVVLSLLCLEIFTNIEAYPWRFLCVSKINTFLWYLEKEFFFFFYFEYSISKPFKHADLYGNKIRTLVVYFISLDHGNAQIYALLHFIRVIFWPADFIVYFFIASVLSEYLYLLWPVTRWQILPLSLRYMKIWTLSRQQISICTLSPLHLVFGMWNWKRVTSMKWFDFSRFEKIWRSLSRNCLSHQSR